MKIKTQVSISLIIFAILAVVIIFFAYSSYIQIQDIQKKQQIIDSIEQSSFDLYYLENDYFIHGGAIPFELWNAKYAALSGQLQALILTDPSQKAVLNQMFNSQKELKKSFSNLVAVTSREQGTGSGGVNQELIEFSASTLEGQTQTLMSRSSELSQLVKAEALAVEQRTVLIISFSIAVLILFVLLNYLAINRSVLKSISALQNGAERIGSGDLDTKIETFSNDELGYLSHEFNEMTSRLNTAKTLLLTSNIELERKNQEFMAANEQLAAAEEELKSQFDALAESEGKFRGIFDHINDGIQIHDIEPDGKPGKFIEVNEVASRMLQYTREEMLKHSPIDFATDYHSKPLDQIFLENSTTGHTIFETGHIRKDGTVLPVEINTHVVNLLGKRVLVAVVRDITERKKAEAIRDQQLLFTTALNEIAEVIHSNDNSEDILENSNRIIAETLLLDRALIYDVSFENNHITGLCEWLNQDDPDIAATKGKYPLDMFKGPFTEIKRTKKYLKSHFNAVNEHFISDGSGKILHDQMKIKSLIWYPFAFDEHGYHVFTLNQILKPRQWTQEEITFLESVAKQVSLALNKIKLLKERELVKDTLVRVNQKLNVLSQLTRNDLANQIFVLSSYLELAKHQLVGQDHVIEILQKGVEEVRIIQETLGYSKDYQDMGAKPPKWQIVKMAFLLGISHISIKNIQHSLETENLEIFADPLLEKVCQRLFENSVKHGEHVTRIRVWHTVTPDEATIFFEDDGIGIPGVRKEQIFLRREGTSASRGSLIFVREILDITGITIREMGEPGMGARFELMVPKGAWRMEVRAD